MTKENEKLKNELFLYKTAELFKIADDASIIKELRKTIKKLEKTIKKMSNTPDSNNSGIPTSQTPIAKKKKIPNSRIKSDKSVGAQIGREKKSLEKFTDDETFETVEVNYGEECECGGRFIEIDTIYRDVLDLLPLIKKIRYEYKVLKCDKCGKVVKPNIPAIHHADCSYGSTIKTLILTLINEINVPYNKIKSLLYGLSEGEIDVSVGYMAKLQKNTVLKLDDFISELKDTIVKEPVLNWDDTVISVDTKRACLRFYGNEKLALYTAHPQKNVTGVKLDGILDKLTENTTLVHDHYSHNYNKEYKFKNGECNSHCIRDVTKIKFLSEHFWCDKFITLLISARDGNKTAEFVERIKIDYDLILEEATKEREDDTTYIFKDESTLIKRLSKYKDNYLMFMTDPRIPFTNNTAERALRPVKSKMKSAGQFKNIVYARSYATIRSYTETAKRNGCNYFSVLKRLTLNDYMTLKEMQIS